MCRVREREVKKKMTPSFLAGAIEGKQVERGTAILLRTHYGF